MNEIARLEYELAYYDSAVHRFNHRFNEKCPFGISYKGVLIFKYGHNILAVFVKEMLLGVGFLIFMNSASNILISSCNWMIILFV